jgi:hypothetical protein
VASTALLATHFFTHNTALIPLTILAATLAPCIAALTIIWLVARRATQREFVRLLTSMDDGSQVLIEGVPRARLGRARRATFESGTGQDSGELRFLPGQHVEVLEPGTNLILRSFLSSDGPATATTRYGIVYLAKVRHASCGPSLGDAAAGEVTGGPPPNAGLGSAELVEPISVESTHYPPPLWPRPPYRQAQKPVLDAEEAKRRWRRRLIIGALLTVAAVVWNIAAMLGGSINDYGIPFTASVDSVQCPNNRCSVGVEYIQPNGEYWRDYYDGVVPNRIHELPGGTQSMTLYWFPADDQVDESDSLGWDIGLMIGGDLILGAVALAVLGSASDIRRQAKARP